MVTVTIGGKRARMSEKARQESVRTTPKRATIQAWISGPLCLHFLVSYLKPREVHTRRQAQRQIGTAHEANRAHVGDGGAGSAVGLRQW